MSEGLNKSSTQTSVRRNSYFTIALVLAGIAVNFLFSELAAFLSLPIFLDSIGTILAAVIGGYLPGILTGIITNAVNYFIDDVSIYYASISAMMALTVAYFSRKNKLKSLPEAVQLILLLAFWGGIAGAVITWFLTGPAQEGFTANAIGRVSSVLGLNSFASHVIVTFLLDIIDKTICTCISLLIIHFLPERIREFAHTTGWMQKPLSDEELEEISGEVDRAKSLQTRVAVVIVVAALLLSTSFVIVSGRMFSEYSRNQHAQLADSMANVVADMIDPDMVDTYLEQGEDAPGYKAIRKQLANLRENTHDIEFVYVYAIREDGCHVVFDIDTDAVSADEPGSVIPFDESFAPYISDLLAGREIEPIETNDTFGWLLTVYKPVYDSAGECKCYAAVDIEVPEMQAYERSFITKVILLCLGFFILILTAGIWVSRYRIILPINSMASSASAFAFHAGEEQAMDMKLDQIRALDIRTDDEVENLYKAFVKMTEDTINYSHEVKEKAEEVSELQRGLIITLADVVEGRDSDTGNHVRKTADYVEVIVKGLKRGGYYADRLSDKFVDDVVRSAPLHDIGKIAISDVILNKTGKLTDEEYAIMKTHTTEGKDLISKVIETVHGASYLEEARNMAAYHHEKWDGSGYPEGLRGEEIPLSARIMAVADVFDALTSRRVYKEGMPLEKAAAIIEKDAGTHFDPVCVEAFKDSIGEIGEVLDYYKSLDRV